MAATGTPRKAVRASRAQEGGSTWTPAQPPLGFGTRADPGPEVTSLSQLDETPDKGLNGPGRKEMSSGNDCEMELFDHL